MNAPAENVAPCALLLGTILLDKPSSSTVMPLLEGLASMDLPAEWPYGDEATLERISQQLRRALKTAPADLDRDYHRLLVGPGKLAAPPWGSVYLDSESVLFGDSCIALGRWMRARGIELHEGESREPVDHIGRMLVLLSWLCDNQPDRVIPFMEEHLMTWAPRYFAQLEPAAAGTLYEPLGHLASLTLEGVPLLRQS